MGRSEIRLRKQITSAGKIKTYRNYAVLMQRHKRDQMIKQAFRFLIYFIIIAMLLILSFVMVQQVKNQQSKNAEVEKEIGKTKDIKP